MHLARCEPAAAWQVDWRKASSPPSVGSQPQRTNGFFLIFGNFIRRHWLYPQDKSTIQDVCEVVAISKKVVVERAHTACCGRDTQNVLQRPPPPAGMNVALLQHDAAPRFFLGRPRASTGCRSFFPRASGAAASTPSDYQLQHFQVLTLDVHMFPSSARRWITFSPGSIALTEPAHTHTNLSHSPIIASTGI